MGQEFQSLKHTHTHTHTHTQALFPGPPISNEIHLNKLDFKYKLYNLITFKFKGLLYSEINFGFQILSQFPLQEQSSVLIVSCLIHQHRFVHLAVHAQ